jgi:undecaprenyl pyrophosphate phosphatase UppP
MVQPSGLSPKPENKSKVKMSDYKKEASTRILYFSGAFLLSVLIALVIAVIFGLLFRHSSFDDRRRTMVWSFIISFIILCGFGVYKIDKVLSGRYNKNPD